MSELVVHSFTSQKVDNIKLESSSTPIVYRGDLDDADFIAWLRNIASAIEGKQRYEAEIKSARKALRDKEEEQERAYALINKSVYLAYEDVQMDKGKNKAEINCKKNGMSMNAVLYSNKQINAADIEDLLSHADLSFQS
ncbi:hypothetical protein [Pectobacterium parvum]|uniref:hypothetical protein n=1 Tax=Pectobacterium parvum TaxID=2778550 RepID=UPI002158F496|nr:hypothetical protein [Pectobacterium parvum]UVD96631.1 hypothetical protein NV347_16600 [Pectobacterium parvum]